MISIVFICKWKVGNDNWWKTREKNTLDIQMMWVMLRTLHCQRAQPSLPHSSTLWPFYMFGRRCPDIFFKSTPPNQCLVGNESISEQLFSLYLHSYDAQMMQICCIKTCQPNQADLSWTARQLAARKSPNQCLLGFFDQSADLRSGAGPQAVLSGWKSVGQTHQVTHLLISNSWSSFFLIQHFRIRY